MYCLVESVSVENNGKGSVDHEPQWALWAPPGWRPRSEESSPCPSNVFWRR